MPHATSNSALDALTEWWEDMGVDVDHALLDSLQRAEAVPSTREATGKKTSAGKPAPRKLKTARGHEEWLAEAERAAAACTSIDDVKTALEAFDGCPLKEACRNTVVYDGTIGAPLMVIGEGPGGQEDIKGLPFVGKAGQLLDKMLAAINASRTENTFITNVNFWRPPGNRNPEPEELAVCRPFVNRLIELGEPKLIIATGGVAAKSLLETKTGIMRLRGSEHEFTLPNRPAIPLIPTLHPAYLLRRPQDKSRAWRDLLLIEQRLNELGVTLKEH